MLTLAWLRCLVRNQHLPVRNPLGGFKCENCGFAGADLDEMGYKNQGYVAPVRRVFVRGRECGSSMTSSWEPTKRGW